MPSFATWMSDAAPAQEQIVGMENWHAGGVAELMIGCGVVCCSDLAQVWMNRLG